MDISRSERQSRGSLRPISRSSFWQGRCFVVEGVNAQPQLPFAQSADAHNRTFGCLLLVLFRCARIFRMVPSCA